MSNLEKHAEFEMRRAGLYDKDADYGGMIPESVIKMVKVLCEGGHSGGSHYLTMKIFNRVANFKTLTPITSDLSEWMEVGRGITDKMVRQNKRQSSAFSVDGCKTWYDLDDPKKKNWPNRGFINWLKRKLK